jgi:hypothetical protein
VETGEVALRAGREGTRSCDGEAFRQSGDGMARTEGEQCGGGARGAPQGAGGCAATRGSRSGVRLGDSGYAGVGPTRVRRVGMHEVGEKNNSFLAETISKLRFFGTP